MSPFEPGFIVKVCGITCGEDLDASLAAGANAIGFNFYRKSPRYILPARAGVLQTPRECLRVGIFVNATRADTIRVFEEARLDVAQVYGPDVPSGLRVWRSIPANSPIPLALANVEAYLLETPTPDYGGSGRTFDWASVQQFPYRMIVAGGLTAENVGNAIALLKPWGVDACSRLETSPGRKDPARVRTFVAAAWRAHEALAEQEVRL